MKLNSTIIGTNKFAWAFPHWLVVVGTLVIIKFISGLSRNSLRMVYTINYSEDYRTNHNI